MSKLHDLNSERTTRQAVDWLVRLDRGTLTSAEKEAYETWLAADAAHARALDSARKLWSDLGEIPRPTMTAPARFVRIGKWNITAAALAAAALVAAVLIADVPMRLQADARTAVGAVAEVNLPDGSIAMLDTNSAIAIDFSGSERQVRLLRGEAHFSVSPDPDRPFNVLSVDGSARALGTKFLVRRADTLTTVTVTEHRVAVRPSRESAEEVVLGEGQQIHYGDQKLGSVRDVDIDTVSAWTRGKLIFVDRPLSDVADELDRYFPGRIVITDPAVRERRINGVFETANPAGTVETLARSLSLRMTRVGDFAILLYQ